MFDELDGLVVVSAIDVEGSQFDLQVQIVRVRAQLFLDLPRFFHDRGFKLDLFRIPHPEVFKNLGVDLHGDPIGFFLVFLVFAKTLDIKILININFCHFITFPN